jgi:adenylate cyclase class 2
VAVEAELKARVRDPDHVRSRLDQLARPEASTYADRYFDYPDRRLGEAGEELRVRTISGADGHRRTVLTYKAPPVDSGSGSKPEYETVVGDADVVATVLSALGAREFIAFEKRCTNYRFTMHGRDLLATLVRVPELEDEMFIELETIAEADDVDQALTVVRTVLVELGIGEDDLTSETYTGAVAAQRDDSTG